MGNNDDDAVGIGSESILVYYTNQIMPNTKIHMCGENGYIEHAKGLLIMGMGY